MKRISVFLVVSGCAVWGVGCQSAGPTPVTFGAEIKPLLESRCINCHNSQALLGNLNLENRSSAFQLRPTGPAIIPGNPEQSPLYLVLSLPAGDQKAMPPVGHRIPPEEVALIKRWIAEGATWPTGAHGVLRPTPPSAAPEA